MLNKALLSSPKEFRISIGTQTYCTASVNKSSAMPGDLVTVTVRSNTGYGNGERQKFCVHGIIGARQTGASNEHEHQTQFS